MVSCVSTNTLTLIEAELSMKQRAALMAHDYVIVVELR